MTEYMQTAWFTADDVETAEAVKAVITSYLQFMVDNVEVFLVVTSQ